MSASMEHTINCDVCGHWEREFGTASRVRGLLKHRGWARSKNQDTGGMEDVCPNCKDKSEENQ